MNILYRSLPWFFTFVGLAVVAPGADSGAAQPPPDSAKPAAGRALSHPHPSPEAARLFAYLHSLRGKAILSGQQEGDVATLADCPELDYIRETTGKLPAVLGLDYIRFEHVTDRAIAWWRRGGISSICWHWGAPTHGPGYPASKEAIDVEQALTPGTELNRVMLEDMDRVARELVILRDANVPVIWRPLHELNGDWFWWGKAGPDAFKRLWRLMHERYTVKFGLNNLIWVLGYTSKPDAAWYPGDAYVDIAGADNYRPGTQATMYRAAEQIVGPHRLLAYHECGPIPDPDALIAEQIHWSWFLTWHTIHIRNQNTPEALRKIYHHPYVLTLDELPNLRQP